MVKLSSSGNEKKVTGKKELEKLSFLELRHLITKNVPANFDEKELLDAHYKEFVREGSI